MRQGRAYIFELGILIFFNERGWDDGKGLVCRIMNEEVVAQTSS